MCQRDENIKNSLCAKEKDKAQTTPARFWKWEGIPPSNKRE